MDKKEKYFEMSKHLRFRWKIFKQYMKLRIVLISGTANNSALVKTERDWKTCLKLKKNCLLLKRISARAS